MSQIIQPHKAIKIIYTDGGKFHDTKRSGLKNPNNSFAQKSVFVYEVRLSTVNFIRMRITSLAATADVVRVYCNPKSACLIQ